MSELFIYMLVCFLLRVPVWILFSDLVVSSWY